MTLFLNSELVFLSGRRPRGGIEQQQMTDLLTLLDATILSNSGDRWICDLSSDGIFKVSAVRNYLDDLFLPIHPDSTRWVKSIPIKINVFAWRARRDCLPSRSYFRFDPLPGSWLIGDESIMRRWAEHALITPTGLVVYVLGSMATPITLLNYTGFISWLVVMEVSRESYLEVATEIL
nr:RNA-directed DNA polymerase, eukaryota [Tanacetum cinerariifolium]